MESSMCDTDSKLTGVIRRISYKFGKYRNMPVDAEDVAQEMWLFWLSHKDKWNTEKTELSVQIRRLAWRAGTYAAEQKYQTDGTRSRIKYFLADVRGIMDATFKIWSDPETLAALTTKQFETWQKFFTVLEDIAPEDKTILERKFRDGEKLNGPERARLHRALEAVTDMLNAYYRQDRVDEWFVTGVRDAEVISD